MRRPLVAGPSGTPNLTTASGIAVALTGGPALTLALAGEYEYQFVCMCQSQVGATNGMMVSLQVNTANVGKPAQIVAAGVNLGGSATTLQRGQMSASAALRLACLSSTSSSPLFTDGAIQARPIGVG
jgi:hypothetical protein